MPCVSMSICVPTSRGRDGSSMGQGGDASRFVDALKKALLLVMLSTHIVSYVHVRHATCWNAYFSIFVKR